MKNCIIVTKFLGNKTDLISLSYLAFLLARTQESSLILIEEGVKLALKETSIPIGENFKKIISAQTGLDLKDVENHKDLLILLKRKYKTKFNVCDTSLVALGISNKLGDGSKIEDFFEIATIFEITSILSQADLIIYF